MFDINKQLQKDTHYLIKKDCFHLLLLKNASIPWVIIVPETHVVEVFDLPEATQQSLNKIIQQVAHYFRQEFASTKMNVAAIGNIVSQLHIHVIGRQKGDGCWPDVVWGNEYPFVEWSNEKLKKIKQSFKLTQIPI